MSPLLSTENHIFFGARVFAFIRRFSINPTQFIATICVALLLSVPFLLPVNGLPVPTFYQEWVAVALGSAAFLAILFAQSKTGVEVPRIVLLPLGILILLLIQIAQGRLMYWQQGAIGAMYLFWSAAMMCVGRALRQSLGWERFCVLTAWAVCIGALLSAFFGALQLIGWQMGGLVMPMIGPRVHANLGQANHFANYLFLGLFATFYLACTRRLNVFAAVGAMVLLLAVGNLSGSRSIWLYLVGAVLLAVWSYRGAKSTQTKTLLIWTVASILLALVLQRVSAGALEQSTLRHLTAGARLTIVDAGYTHRLVEWMASLLMFKSAPFAGVGFNGFGWNYFLLAGPLPAGIPEEITDNAHNLLLHLFAEFGLPGGILLIGAALIWWLRQFREKASIHRWWMLSVVAVICVHSLLEYPLWYAYFLGPFALFVGAGDNAVWHSSPALASRIIVTALCVGVVWTLASLFHDYRRVERLGIVSAQATTQSDVRRDAIHVSRSTLFPNLVELGLSRTISLDRNELDAKLELNGRVLRTYPAGDVAYRQSALLALSGDMAAAYRHWDLALAAYPSRASKVVNTLARSSSMGEARLEPLLEYAASRTKE